ncbi:DNA repair protein [Mycena venus]|uniref:DNA repair protein REV1 n=1 Tax=Mycena venus TaxID=2733690 RepID=A0A8H7CGE4_9AGAR|nr:DNA repair protein [Mycena venus]
MPVLRSTPFQTRALTGMERKANVYRLKASAVQDFITATLASGSQSSEYFEDEDPAFLNALDATVLPGDVQAPANSVPENNDESDSDDNPEPPPPGQPQPQPSLKRRRYDGPDPVDEVIYGAAEFGNFGQYMKRKRAKLQIQNSEINTTTAETQIFKGVTVYVNGWTSPSVQEIRSLLVRNGGIFEPYLAKHSMVTHIVTCALTEAKMREFKNMKVVRPEWLTESVKARYLLPWRDFVFVQDARPAPASTQAPAAPAQPQTAQLQIPRYAADASNPNAQRAMADAQWRNANTSAAPGFIKGYFEHSRLHFLSASKAQLQELVREAQARAESNLEQKEKENLEPDSPAKGKGRAGDGRVIMHCDFDCFFVAAGLVTRPQMRGKPVVVCHSQGAQGGSSSTSEIACASYEARAFGIKNGMSLQQARKLCPTILTVPYEFERYTDLSLKFYTVLMSHADDVQAVSIDEALVDVTTAVSRLRRAAESVGSPHDPAKDFAERIRAEVKQATQCEISIGISHNILLARLATRRAKPAGALHIVAEDVPALMATLDITNLWGFASSHREKAMEKLGSTALKDLASKSRAVLSEALGKKTGEKLYNAIRGIDDTQLSSDKQRKSVSAEVNYGIRFESSEAAEKFIFDLAGEVEVRLNEIKMLGRTITLKIMKRDPSAPVEPPKFLGHGACEVFNKQTPLVGPGGRATSDAKAIGDHAWRILQSFNFDPKELRGIGIQIQKLEPAVGPVNTGANQRTLNFKPMEVRRPPAAAVPVRPASPAAPNNNNAGPSTSADVSLPSIEEVDQDVLDALPPEMRQELEDAWRRRSESPFPGKAPAAPLIPHVPRPPSRPPSRAPSIAPQSAVVLPQRRSAQPTRMHQGALRLAPRSGGGYVIDKTSIHPNRPPNAFLRPTDADLRNLNIDPEVFALLPQAVQREQLTVARLIKTRGALPEVSGERLILKPKKYIPPPNLFRQPPPYAKYPEKPKLRTQGKSKGEKVFFTETDDVQGLLEAWVNAFKRFGPEEKDIEFFAKFLVQSVESADTGVERAVAVVKWWLVLLRRYWGDYEHFDELGYDAEDAKVAEAWWKAFRDVKERIDLVARKKFGGKLSLR